MRTRNWTFLIYPDSAPSNFLDLLSDLHLPLALSPLHSLDLADDGLTYKKPHYHVLINFRSVQSYESVMQISKQFSGVKAEPARDNRACFRYLIHADNPEKYQYALSDIKLYGGFSPPLATRADDLATLKEITNFIIDNNIQEVSDLCKVAIQLNNGWLDALLTHNNYFILKLIDSNRHKK